MPAGIAHDGPRPCGKTEPSLVQRTPLLEPQIGNALRAKSEVQTMYSEYWRCGSRITDGSGQLSGLPVLGSVSGLCTSTAWPRRRPRVRPRHASPAATTHASSTIRKPV